MWITTKHKKDAIFVYVHATKMSTDCIIKCSSANKCTKMNVVTFCHITWSMHLINLLLHHIIIQLLCLNAYVIWQWAQQYAHDCMTPYSRPGQAALSVTRHAVHRHTCTHSHACTLPGKHIRSHDCQVTCHTHSQPHPLLMHALCT